MMLGWGKIKQRSLKSRIQGSQGDLANSAVLCSIQASAAVRVLLFRRRFHVQQMWSLRVGWQHGESAPACPCRDGEVQSIPLLAIIFSYEGNDSNLIIYYFPVLKVGFSGHSGKENLSIQEMQEMRVWLLSQADLPEEERAAHSNILAWRISWTEKPGGHPIRLHRFEDKWATEHTYTQFKRK